MLLHFIQSVKELDIVDNTLIILSGATATLATHPGVFTVIGLIPCCSIFPIAQMPTSVKINFIH